MTVRDGAVRAELRQTLARDARRLRDDHREGPVDLARVARRLGLGLEQDASGEVSEGRLVRRDGRALVVHAGPLDAPRSRLSVAHEIGHHLLDCYGVPRPGRPHEYWLMEELCNEFAACLLVPEVAVEWVRTQRDDPERLLERARRAARRVGVSRAAISHRLVRDVDDLAFCEVRYHAPRPEVVGVVAWVAQGFQLLERGARSYIGADHPLAPLLVAQRGRRSGHIAPERAGTRPVAGEQRVHGVWIVATKADDA